MSTPKLFQQHKLGRMQLQHRVVMPGLTRNRAGRDGIVTDTIVEHYRMRAAVPGTFLRTEATYVLEQDAGLPWRGLPGIWNDEQTAAWKKVRKTLLARGNRVIRLICGTTRLLVPFTQRDRLFSARYGRLDV